MELCVWLFDKQRLGKLCFKLWETDSICKFRMLPVNKSTIIRRLRYPANSSQLRWSRRHSQLLLLLLLAVATGGDVSDVVYSVLYQLNAAHKACNYSIINRRGAIVAAVVTARRQCADVCHWSTSFDWHRSRPIARHRSDPPQRRSRYRLIAQAGARCSLLNI